MSLFLALFALVPPAVVSAQTEREQLPLRFAKVSPEVAKQLDRDWRRMARVGVEWGYCVTEWQTATTSDGDTVFIATRATMRQSLDATRSAIRFTCTGDDGAPLPRMHTHLDGDCTPSRSDIRDALSREAVPFGLIMCGPNVTATIDPQLNASALGYHVRRATQ